MIAALRSCSDARKAGFEVLCTHETCTSLVAVCWVPFRAFRPSRGLRRTRVGRDLVDEEARGLAYEVSRMALGRSVLRRGYAVCVRAKWY